jgi:hypothetical protein
MKNNVVLIIGILLLSSCNKNEKDITSFVDKPVIEAYLKVNEPVSVKISRQITASENITYKNVDLNNLSVSIWENDVEHKLQLQGFGMYGDTTFIVKESAEYTLRFVYDTDTVLAKTTIPRKPVNFKQSVKDLYIQKIDFSSGPPSGDIEFPDPVKLTWDNADGSYYMIVVENTESSPEMVNDTTEGQSRPSFSFRNEPTTSNIHEIRSMEFQYFGKHRVVLYHMNPDYAILYDNDNNTSQNLTTPDTDIKNAVGIFTGINTDTLYIQVKKK